MSQKSIATIDDLRQAVALLTSNVNALCNANTSDEIVKHFISAKDLLVEIYKFNVERLSH